MKKLLVLAVCSIAMGCSSFITVPISTVSPMADKATLVIYPEIEARGLEDDYTIILNDNLLGKVTSEKSLIAEVDEGEYEIYAEKKGSIPLTPVVRRTTKIKLKKNQVHYVRLWLEVGIWT